MAMRHITNNTTALGYRRPGAGKGGISRTDHRASRVVIQRNPCDITNNACLKLNKCNPIKICTWNVKTMYEAGKIHNAILEMERLSINIMGISEMRWTDSGSYRIKQHRIYYSGNTNGQHIHGVGIILQENIAKHVINFVPISERMLLIQINTKPIKTNIIQVYAPTADKSDEEIELFYNELTNVLRKLNKNEVILVMGDFNAKIGKGRSGDLVGPFGLGERNERGDRLNIFAMEEDLVLTNTFFKLPPRRLYTWKSPQDSPTKVIRNQIDYIMINKRYRNAIISVKTYPGADIKSDHNPLVGIFTLKLKRIERQKTIKYDLRKMKNEQLKQVVEQRIEELIDTRGEWTSVDEEVEKLQEINQKILDEHLRPTRTKKKQWMTDNILIMMDDRRKYKNENSTKYKQIDREIKKAIRVAKNKWFEEQCTEIETFERNYDSFNLHKKVKEAAGLYKPKTAGQLTDDHNNPITDIDEKRNAWLRYVEESFSDDRQTFIIMDCKTGPRITIDEVRAAIKRLKNGKSTGPDNFYAEILKVINDAGIEWLTAMFNDIYDSGNIPRSWLKSTFITLPKKPGAKKCDDFRIISLMSHLLKTFLKIIHNRIYKKCEAHISRTQFGFRNALGVRDALFAVQVLFQRCRDVNCDVYVCFIDYRKAFDRVKHDKLLSILKSIDLDDKDIRVINNIYYNQTANIKIDGQYTEDIAIERGVRQGCILSPLLFNIYSEEIIRTALEEIDEGILVNGERLNNIRYADDTIIFADSLEGLQSLVSNLLEKSQRLGLEFNIKKTKYMVISKNQIPHRELVVEQQPIERVSGFTYLGTTINDQWDHSVEIKRRIEMARTSFVKMNKIFRSRDILLNTKVRLLRCYVFSVLMHGVESWTLTEATMKRLEAFEMWCYRRILRISWVDRVTNVEVLRRMGTQCEIPFSVKRRKLEYLGHIMRNEQRYGLQQLILQGKVYGKRGPGRRRNSWLQNLRMWFSLTTTDLFRATVNKVRIALLIANIRNG